MTRTRATNARWNEDHLIAERQKVLCEWRTGNEIRDLGACVEFNKQQLERAPHKDWRTLLQKANDSGDTLIEGFLSHTTVDHTVEACLEVERRSRPDCWLLTGDTPTRKGQWGKAEAVLSHAREESARHTLSNGWAFVNEGVGAVRRFTDRVSVPARMATQEEGVRLQAEIALAGGMRCAFLSAFNDLFQHCKDLALEKRMEDLQYCSRLAAYYDEHGAATTGWIMAHLSTWQSPGMKLAVLVLDALVVVNQGVNFLTFTTSSNLHLAQTAASIRAAQHILQEYLNRFGHKNVVLVPGYSNYQCPWPVSRDRAAGLIGWETAIALLSGATLIRTRSPDEAICLPTAEGVVSGIEIARQVQRAIGRQRLEPNEEVTLEQEMIEKEARAIVDTVLEMGDGDVIRGAAAAVEAGVIDATFSPWKSLKQQVVVLKDAGGAIRYWQPGNVPVPIDVLEFHRERLATRERIEQCHISEDLVAADILSQA